jgi:hypothetical protein
MLPEHWVLREYRPDYGLDFALEIFAVANDAQQPWTSQTLGEHIFIQLKSVQSCNIKPLKLYGRTNVEKAREALDKEELVGEMDTVRFQLETPGLVTVERMGVGVPVLLVVADISRDKCFFVCLNDYIDKILVPRHPNYREKGSRTIHVPVLNQVGSKASGVTALRWYGKRPKLFAAFQRFVYQNAELERSWSSPDWLSMARYFAERIAYYDFWEDTEMWSVVKPSAVAVRRFLESMGEKHVAQEVDEELRRSEVLQIWRSLSLMPRNYEDICREWFLPTALGKLTSY